MRNSLEAFHKSVRPSQWRFFNRYMVPFIIYPVHFIAIFHCIPSAFHSDFSLYTQCISLRFFNTLHSPTSPGGLLVHSWSIPESWWTPGSLLKFLRSPSPFLPHSCPIPASFLICVNMGMGKCPTSKYGNLL